MNSELITDIVDLARTQGQIDSLIAGLKGVDEAIKNIRPLTDVFKGSQGAADMRKAQADMEEANRRLIETQKQLADAITRINDLEQKLASDRVARSKQAMDAYTQLNNQYKDAIRNAQNMAIEYGKESEQALKAAEAAGELKQKLLEVNEAAKSGGSGGKFDPNSVPSVINTGNNDDLEKTGTVVTELEEKEAQLTNTSMAMGQAQLEAGEAVKVSGENIEGISLKYDEYTGTLQQNLEVLLENTQAIATNRAAQKEMADGVNTDVAALARLKQEEMELVQTNKDLSLTVRNQVKDYQSADGSIDEMQAQISLLKQSYEQLSAAEKASPFGQNMLREVETLDTAVKAAEREIGNAQRNVGNYTDAVSQAGGKIVQFIQRDLLRSIAGFIVFQLAFEAVQALIDKLGEMSREEKEASDRAKELSDSQQQINGAIYSTSSAYGEAMTNVTRLREEVELAKNGFVEKQKVVDDYNKSMGQATGQVKSLNEVENKLVKDADPYIQMMFYKATANAFLEDATRKAVQAEKDRQFLEEKANIKPVEKYGAGQEKVFQEARSAAQRQMSYQQQEQDQSIKLYQDYMKKAADLAKQFHFDLMGGDANGSGKKSVDYTAAMMEAEKMLNDAKARYNKSDLEQHAKYDKQLMDDERNNYAIRLAAIKDYYDTQEKLADLSKRKELGDIEIKLNEIAKIEAKPAAQRTVEENKLLLQKKAWLQLQKDAEQDYANNVLGIHQDMTNKLADLNDRQNANALKSLQKYIEDFKNGQIEDLFRGQEKAIDDLKEKLDAGTISVEKFNQKQQEVKDGTQLSQWELEAEAIENVIDLYNFFGMDTVELEKKAAALRKEIKDKEYSEDVKRREELNGKDKERFALQKQLAEQTAQVFQTIGDGVYTKQLNAIQKQIDANTTWKDAEIERINASTLSEQDKAAKIAQINAEAQAKQDQLDKQKRDAQLRQAKFDRDMSLLKIVENTYMAVTSDNSNPLTAWKVPYDIALGALAAAEVLAKPLPTYAVGTSSSKKGWALTDELGPEMYITPGGQTFMGNDRPTMRYLEQGTRIIPHDQVSKAMQAMMAERAMSVMGRPMADQTAHKLDQLLASHRWQTKRLEKAYSNKPKVVNNIKIDPKMGDWLSRNVYN